MPKHKHTTGWTRVYVKKKIDFNKNVLPVIVKFKYNNEEYNGLDGCYLGDKKKTYMFVFEEEDAMVFENPRQALEGINELLEQALMTQGAIDVLLQTSKWAEIIKLDNNKNYDKTTTP